MGFWLVACQPFFKYADLTGYVKRKKKPKTECRIGFRANNVFEWLHIDVTLIQTQNDGVQRVAFVKDNSSRALLHYKSTSGSADSNFIRELLEETFAKYHLLDAQNPINILTDGGSENKGAVIDWINNLVAPPVVRKITAKTFEFPFSNSMSESTHSIYKTEYMQRKLSLDVEQHIIDLDNFMIYYNHNRYPFKLYGLTPFKVLNGEVPHKNRFRSIIKDAQKNRLTENQAFNDCPILCF
jgi:transposase InsO family protein